MDIEHEPAKALRAAVAVAVGRPVSEVRDVRHEPLEYDAFLAHRSVSRLRGSAAVDGGHVEWSLIEKRTEGPDLASPYLLDNGRREYDAYASGLLDDLASGIRAPHLYGTWLEPDDAITLWLEEIHREGPPSLTAEAILDAARDLGGMSGRWLGRTLGEPWYFTEWMERHGQSGAIAAGLATLRRAHPAAVARLGDQLTSAERLILLQPRLRDILESLPQTLCHHDAVGANVFTTDAGTILIDWESVGPGPVGADLASLLFASVRRGDASIDVVAPLMEDALQSYAEGVSAAGGDITYDDVHRGFDAAVALRWKLAVDVVATLESGEAARRGSLPNEAPETAMDELVELVPILLASASRVLG
jgi:hypothetical protein